jgi:hypothetical protein
MTSRDITELNGRGRYYKHCLLNVLFSTRSLLHDAALNVECGSEMSLFCRIRVSHTRSEEFRVIPNRGLQPSRQAPGGATFHPRVSRPHKGLSDKWTLPYCIRV